MTRAPLLAVRPDGMGDMVLTGPALRALAVDHDVVVLAGPDGAAAAELLPGVSEVIVWRCPWILAEPPAVDARELSRLCDTIAARQFSEAVIFTSFHQSALPTALLLRLAQVPRICAFSEDYPGALLDVRVPPPGDIGEAKRALALVAAAGHRLAAGDPGGLRLRADLPDVTELVGEQPYVVLHPGVSAPARAWPARRWAQACEALTDDGVNVVLTGSSGDRELCRSAVRGPARNLAGRTEVRQLAAVLAGADVVVVANTGAAHLAAAVGTPVVSLFAPVVPAARWRPDGVPLVLLGDQDAPCRGTRARVCPVPGHPCLSEVSAHHVVSAVHRLAATNPRKIGVVS